VARFRNDIEKGEHITGRPFHVAVGR
jgi:hypothetical protein